MNEQNNQKINIVNPLNPDEIIRTELLIKQTDNVINDVVNEEVVEQVVEKNTKKKINPIIFVILVILLVLFIGGYFLITNYLKTDKELENPSEVPNVKVITLNDISNNFNQNIGNYNVIENSQISSSVSDNKIIVSITTNNEIIKYEYSLADRKLTSIVANDDIVGYAITIYMFSAVAQYYDLNFDDVVTYLNNNINDLTVVNNIEVEELEQIKNISINIDQTMIIQ